MQFFCGENGFAIDAALRELAKKYLDAYGDLAIEHHDATDATIDSLTQAIRTLPFLVEKKLVIIRHAAERPDIVEALLESVDHVSSDIEVAVDIQGIDRRKVLFKEIKKQGLSKEFASLQGAQLERWLTTFATEHGGTLSARDAGYLIAPVGTNQLRLAREVEKLLLYKSDIDRKTIDLLTEQSLQSSVFALLDAAFAGDSRRALELYREQRRGHVEPVYILAMIVWQLTMLAQAVHAPEDPQSALVNLGHASFTAGKAARLARSISAQQLATIIDQTVACDRAIKTSADADSALELLIVSLT